MKRSPFWKIYSSSASRGNARILWKPKVHYRNHKRPLPAPFLDQINLVHAPALHFLNTHFNIILF